MNYPIEDLGCMDEGEGCFGTDSHRCVANINLWFYATGGVDEDEYKLTGSGYHNRRKS